MIATPHLTPHPAAPSHDLGPILDELGLSALLTSLPERTREAAERGLPYEEYLRRVLSDAARAKRRRPALVPAEGGPSTGSEGAPRLEVGPQGRWFEVAGRGRVDLARRGPIRRVLWALVEAQPEGRALDVDEVVEAGWPGEIVGPEQGATRVYTAIRTLRRLGLEGVLLTWDAGYLLDPRADLSRHDA